MPHVHVRAARAHRSQRHAHLPRRQRDLWQGRPSARRSTRGNPVLLVEITSPSTEAYDRGPKLDQYKRLPSVQEVLLVSHRQRHLALHRRAPDGTWSVHEVEPGQTLELLSIGGKLDVNDVYRDGLESA